MKLFFFLLFSASINLCYGQKFSKIKPSSDYTYGYVQSNPLIINHGNTGKSYDYFMRLVDHLLTEDDQSLVLLNHFTLRDPDSKRPNPLGRDYQRGLLKKSSYSVYGQVERYQFLSDRTKDTITLFVDLNSRGSLFIPMKLKLKTL